MALRTGLLVFALSVCSLWGQARLTVDQLVSFVQSSIQLKHPDKQVASYLLKLKLSQHLDARTIDELQGLGAGPNTMEALRKLVELSASAPAPPPKPVKIAPPPIPAPPLAEQKALLERVRQYALNYSKNLPNFICTQVTRRYSDRNNSGFWQTEDTLTTRLSYFEQKEKYELVMVNNHSTTQSYHSLGGASSSGEFGSMLQQIFDKDSGPTRSLRSSITSSGSSTRIPGLPSTGSAGPPCAASGRTCTPTTSRSRIRNGASTMSGHRK